MAAILYDGFISFCLIGMLNLNDSDYTSGKVGTNISTFLALAFMVGIMLYLPIYLVYHMFTKWPINDENEEIVSRWGQSTRKRKKVEITAKSLFKRRRFEGGEPEPPVKNELQNKVSESYD